MMGATRAKLFVAIAVALSSACTSSSEGFDAATATFGNAPLASVVTDSGAYRIEVRTAPIQPPTRGTIAAELTITDAKTSAPVDGLAVDVVPWMPAHGHGTSIVTSVTARGGGRYLVGNVSVFMPGRWELRTAVGSDHAVATLDVL